MTFSICVREAGDDGVERFGVAVTTRLPSVGSLSPFVSENGAIATQSLVNVELGRRGISYVDDGLAVGDALEALLNQDEERAERQVHGVDREGAFAFTGADCRGWCGSRTGEGYSVAGNFLTGADVVDAVAAEYEDGERSRPLAARLVDALAAGQAAGGDRREALTVQSAALRVVTSADDGAPAYGNDLRVDASESPVRDLRETYRMATAEFERAAANYERD